MSKRARKLLPGLAAFAVAAALAGGPMPALADADGVVRFATLPEDGPGFPEGIAADAAGNIYVSTFDMRPNVTNVIHVFDHSGHLEATISLPGVLPLGMEFDSAGDLYVANFGGGTVLVERRGSFDGIDRSGAPRGLLFPASLVFSRDSLYVTNPALSLTPAAGDEPEEDVTTFTVSRLPLGPSRTR